MSDSNGTGRLRHPFGPKRFSVVAVSVLFLASGVTQPGPAEKVSESFPSVVTTGHEERDSAFRGRSGARETGRSLSRRGPPDTSAAQDNLAKGVQLLQL